MITTAFVHLILAIGYLLLGDQGSNIVRSFMPMYMIYILAFWAYTKEKIDEQIKMVKNNSQFDRKKLENFIMEQRKMSEAFKKAKREGLSFDTELKSTFECWFTVQNINSSELHETKESFRDQMEYLWVLRVIRKIITGDWGGSSKIPKRESDPVEID